MKQTEKILLIIFIILNSISGLQIRGMSMNTILVGVFFLYIIIIWIQKGSKQLKIKNDVAFTGFALASILSCLFSLFYSFKISHEIVVKSYLINAILYFIVFVLMSNLRADCKIELCDTLKTGLVLAARIQAIWGIGQIALLYASGININEILFVNILNSSNTRDWIMGFYTGKVWNMRITGLNYENSMFALVVCIGAALDKKPIWRWFLIATAILSLSRTGWLMAIAYVVLLLARVIKNNRGNVKKKNLFRNVSIATFIISVAIIVYMRSTVIQRQVANIFLRLYDMNSIVLSGSRHLLYYPYGFLVWLTRFNPIQMLFGYGMRCSGVAFSQNPDICSIVGIGTYNYAWTVECDVIGLLLGGGIVTLFFYYKTIFKGMKSSFKDAMFILLVGGISYHFHSISYVIILLMISVIETQVSRKATKGVYT